MKGRKLIPSKIEREILFRNEASCCVCGKNNVQVHHIDGNCSNNNLKNLAVLCIEHHDQASSRSSMTKHLAASLIRKFKSDWEVRISNKRKIIRSHIILKKEDRYLIKFEIKKLIYSLPAFPNKKSTNAIIEQLYTWHTFSDSTKDILKTFSDIHWFLEGPQISIFLRRIWEFFWQFIGPKDVKMDKGDEREILIAIELIGHFGEQLIIMGENSKIFNDFFAAISSFEDFASWYKNKHIKDALKNQLMSVRKKLLEEKKYPQKSMLLNKLNGILKHY